MTDLEALHNEKLAAHSRENDLPDICSECDNDPDECGCDPEECEEQAALEAAESDWEGARDAYD